MNDQYFYLIPLPASQDILDDMANNVFVDKQFFCENLAQTEACIKTPIGVSEIPASVQGLPQFTAVTFITYQYNNFNDWFDPAN